MTFIANEILQDSPSQSFLLKRFGPEAFIAPYHSHKEFELTLIEEGEGRRFVGSHIGNFKAGDLVLLGSDLPHCWKLKENWTGSLHTNAVVVQFSKAFLGPGFLDKPEFLAIRKLLFYNSVHGIQFTGEMAERVSQRLRDLFTEPSKFYRLLAFLKILHELASDKEMIFLDQKASLWKGNYKQHKRIERVFAYIFENYRSKITLNEVAAVANLTPQAFCKYFKKITRKTLVEVVNEYRMNYAVRQLTKTEKPVSAICYESGFGDTSYFSKQFKLKTGHTPSAYRKLFYSL